MSRQQNQRTLLYASATAEPSFGVEGDFGNLKTALRFVVSIFGFPVIRTGVPADGGALLIAPQATQSISPNRLRVEADRATGRVPVVGRDAVHILPTRTRIRVQARRAAIHAVRVAVSQRVSRGKHSFRVLAEDEIAAERYSWKVVRR